MGRRRRIRHDIHARNPLATGFGGTLGILLAVVLVGGAVYAVNGFIEYRERQRAVAVLQDFADMARAEREEKAAREEKARAERERARDIQAIEDQFAEVRRNREAKRKHEAELERLRELRLLEGDRDERDRRDLKERAEQEALVRAEQAAAEEARREVQEELDRVAAEELRVERIRIAEAMAELKRKNAAAWAKLMPRIERDQRDLQRMEVKEAKLVAQIKRLRAKLGPRIGPWGKAKQGPYTAYLAARGNLRELRDAMAVVAKRLAKKLDLIEAIK